LLTAIQEFVIIVILLEYVKRGVMKRYKKLLTAVLVIGIILVVFAIVLLLFGLIPSKVVSLRWKKAVIGVAHTA